MIVFDLHCRPAGHVFEAWFGSSGDYESQAARGLVQCPICNSSEVGKAVMAPRIAAKGNQRISESAEATSVTSAGVSELKQLMAALAAAQRKVLESSEHVGERFADEARSIHFGEAENRPIHGRVTPADVEALVEDGIPFAPLPFPVIEPEQEN
jgi:hypothetical protein